MRIFGVLTVEGGSDGTELTTRNRRTGECDSYIRATTYLTFDVCSVAWSGVVVTQSDSGRPKRTNKPRAKATSPCSPFAGVFRISHCQTR